MNMPNQLRVLVITLLLAFMASGCAPTAKSESTGGYIDDTVITTKVKTQLLQDDELTSRDIHVDTYKGRVQLSGFAVSQADIYRAVAIAREVPGVRAVENHISVR